MEIIHNGSKFAGEENDTIEQLKERLQKYQLSDFSSIGKSSLGTYSMLGNFIDLSAGFHIILEKSEVNHWRYLFRKNRQLFNN